MSRLFRKGDTIAIYGIVSENQLPGHDTVEVMLTGEVCCRQVRTDNIELINPRFTEGSLVRRKDTGAQGVVLCQDDDVLWVRRADLEGSAFRTRYEWRSTDVTLVWEPSPDLRGNVVVLDDDEIERSPDETFA